MTCIPPSELVLFSNVQRVKEHLVTIDRLSWILLEYWESRSTFTNQLKTCFQTSQKVLLCLCYLTE